LLKVFRSMRLSLRGLAPIAVCTALAGCAHRPAPVVTLKPVPQGRFLRGPAVADDHVPTFANAGWGPFSRADAVAIALREWRLWGMRVDDEPPGGRPPPLPEDKAERQPGLWQRVGEYWWIGQDPGEIPDSYTGEHDENGDVFDASQDAHYAWSAAFISYIMRIDGAGARFPYSENHSYYIDAAAAGSSPVLKAYPLTDYAPELGDLICAGRSTAAGIKFTDLPTAESFPSHCDMVVAVQPGLLTVIGGNVDDSVTEKHVPVTAQGLMAGPDGAPLDTRYSWFVILKVLYDS
jgi:hypothetical protein